MGTEVELKLALAPEATTRLKRHALLKGHKPTRRRLLSLYFDTPGFALSKRGVALRLRRLGYHWVQTMKAEAESIGACTTRPEWEVAITGNQPDLSVLPDEARALLADIRADDLRVCFSTEFTRTAWHIEREGGALELALDQGAVRVGQASDPICEVELELKGGDDAHLFAVARDFLEALPFTLEPRSKAERGYLLAGAIHAAPARGDKPKLYSGQDAGAAWRAMVASALSHLIANVPGALAGDDPEYLHQIRVAVRRLRTMLSLARDLSLDGSLWDEDLRWLMGELSPARDWDVLVVDTLPKLDLPWAGTPNMQALLERIAERRVEANKRARAALTSGRFVRLMLEAEEGMLEAPNLGVTVDGWAIRVLDRRLKRLKRLGKDFAALDAVGQHALRITAKRLRYSAEAFVALHGKSARSYLTRLGRLQDGLGIANDVIVAHGLLKEFARTEHAHAAGLVEGFMTSQARKRGAHLQRLYRRLIDTRPYWV